jgi:hypothetical protein
MSHDDANMELNDLVARLDAVTHPPAVDNAWDPDQADDLLDARLVESGRRARAAVEGRLDLPSRLRRIIGAQSVLVAGSRRGDAVVGRAPAPVAMAAGSRHTKRKWWSRSGAVAVRTHEDGGDRPDKTPDDADDGRGAVIEAVTVLRVAAALERLDIRYLTDGDGGLLALWERHTVLFALEGPTDEILVIRVRVNATVPPDWAERSYRVVNEWNHTRRFLKAYVGDPTDRQQLPIYAELQLPMLAGVHDRLLTELVDCARVVAQGFVDWLHEEGALL